MKNKMQRIVAKISVGLAQLGVLLTFLFWTTQFVYADTVANSKFAKGTEKLLEDLTTWMLVIAPIVTILVVGYYFIRKAISDEMDHKKWSTRISTAIISCVGVVSASLLVKLIVDYYK